VEAWTPRETQDVREVTKRNAKNLRPWGVGFSPRLTKRKEQQNELNKRSQEKFHGDWW